MNGAPLRELGRGVLRGRIRERGGEVRQNVVVSRRYERLTQAALRKAFANRL